MNESRKVSLMYRASGETSGHQKYRVTIKKIDSEFRLKCSVALPERFYRERNSSECVHVEWFDQNGECLKTALRIHEYMQLQKGTLRRRDRQEVFTKHLLPHQWMDSPDQWLRKGDVICRRMDGLLGRIGLWHGAIYIGNGDIVHNAVTQNSLAFLSSLMKNGNDVKVSDISDFSDGRSDSFVIEWLESTKSEEEMVKSALSLVREQNWLTMFGTLQIVEKTS
ncbi:hypothetical protein PMAYCL1PPCAC_30184 [Pristionchus mayeri]|uniref:LRAT domain-containing protein n=1 Tax=Pristionchus mayeri TaxID=1317129 RepID=A0AAN5DBE6_9BILA|nr:hypothetical protein PMAYCL1PPCAC_30184 [Pristionchus mayeri]